MTFCWSTGPSECHRPGCRSKLWLRKQQCSAASGLRGWDICETGWWESTWWKQQQIQHFFWLYTVPRLTCSTTIDIEVNDHLPSWQTQVKALCNLVLYFCVSVGICYFIYSLNHKVYNTSKELMLIFFCTQQNSQCIINTLSFCASPYETKNTRRIRIDKIIV